jgi:hypothetical protein
MHLSRGHVDTRPDSKGRLDARAIVRISDLQTAAADQVCCQASMRVGRVVCVSDCDVSAVSEKTVAVVLVGILVLRMAQRMKRGKESGNGGERDRGELRAG